MKNGLQGILIGLILGITLCSLVFAEQITETISVIFDDYRIYIDGKDASDCPPDQKPMNYNGRIYVPLRFVSEKMGKSVVWEGESKSVYIQNNYSEQFEITPSKSLSTEELMKSSAIINARLNASGINEIQYSLENGKIIFKGTKGTLTKEILEQFVTKGILTFLDKDGNTVLERYDLQSAYVCNDDLLSGTKQPYVELELTDSGREKFSSATERIATLEENGNYIKVMLDKTLISMPYVYQKIDAKKVVINGAFTESSAKNLASILNSDPLPCEFKVK